MNDQRLEELLRSADAEMSAEIPVIVAADVRRRSRRRAMLRIAGPAAALILAVAAGRLGGPDRRIAISNPVPSTAPKSAVPSPTPRIIDVEQMRAESAQLARDADLHAKLAASLIRAESSAMRSSRTASVLAEPDARQAAAAQLDRAARTLVDFGDELLRRQPALDATARGMAADAYRDAVSLFPDSPVAALARERLQQMKI